MLDFPLAFLKQMFWWKTKSGGYLLQMCNSRVADMRGIDIDFIMEVYSIFGHRKI